jgi:hypothetical protein
MQWHLETTVGNDYPLLVDTINLAKKMLGKILRHMLTDDGLRGKGCLPECRITELKNVKYFRTTTVPDASGLPYKESKSSSSTGTRATTGSPICPILEVCLVYNFFLG